MAEITYENHARICFSCRRDTGRAIPANEYCDQCKAKALKPVQFPCVVCGGDTGTRDFKQCLSCFVDGGW